MTSRRIIVFAFLALPFIGAYVLFFRQSESTPKSDAPVVRTEASTPSQSVASDSESVPSTSETGTITSNGFVSPLQRADGRVTKKPFGIFITKATSPVQPERFSGYHVGTDFETFPKEADADVTVSAVCSGKLLSKRTASGYGGIAVESCVYEGSPITVVYGHMRLSSIRPNVGDTLTAGDTIGLLGMGYSTETDGERKHLHLGMHKGAVANVLGYVQTKAELASWIDPCSVVCHP